MRKKVNRDGYKNEKYMNPAMTPEAKESQMVALAIDLAESQLRDGTASSQVIAHYLKLANTRERDRLERDILQKQIEVMDAKIKNYEAHSRIESLFEEAKKAMIEYRDGGLKDEEI